MILLLLRDKFSLRIKLLFLREKKQNKKVQTKLFNWFERNSNILRWALVLQDDYKNFILSIDRKMLEIIVNHAKSFKSKLYKLLKKYLTSII